MISCTVLLGAGYKGDGQRQGVRGAGKEDKRPFIAMLHVLFVVSHACCAMHKCSHSLYVRLLLQDLRSTADLVEHRENESNKALVQHLIGGLCLDVDVGWQNCDMRVGVVPANDPGAYTSLVGELLCCQCASG